MQPSTPEAFFGTVKASAYERNAFCQFDTLLAETQAHTNLVARSTWDGRWIRHYLDSTQLLDFIPRKSCAVLDIGSGGGFPAIPLAILAKTRLPDVTVTLCESISKKAVFLERVVRLADLSNCTVLHGRVSEVAKRRHFNVVTARAVTALPKLIELALPHLGEDGYLLFPKGKRAEVEVDEARKRWSFDLESRKSITDPEASLLLLRGIARKR
ncbi:MAG: 16S rRNA (guanine(527)-N(7))-methyltransferase RsmG [Pseudomonadota bacterium]